MSIYCVVDGLCLGVGGYGEGYRIAESSVRRTDSCISRQPLGAIPGPAIPN